MSQPSHRERSSLNGACWWLPCVGGEVCTLGLGSHLRWQRAAGPRPGGEPGSPLPGPGFISASSTAPPALRPGLSPSPSLPADPDLLCPGPCCEEPVLPGEGPPPETLSLQSQRLAPGQERQTPGRTAGPPVSRGQGWESVLSPCRVQTEGVGSRVSGAAHNQTQAGLSAGNVCLVQRRISLSLRLLGSYRLKSVF